MEMMAGIGLMNNFLSFLSRGCIRLSKSLTKNESRLYPELIDLPPDVMVDILMRLPAKSICSIRCASKTFSDIIDSPFFAQMHVSRSLNSGTSSISVIEEPQLMFNSQVTLEPLKYDGEQGLTKTNHNLKASKILALYNYNHAYNVEFAFCNLFFFTYKHYAASGLLALDLLRGEFMKIPTDEIRSRNYKFQKDYYGMGFDNTAKTYKIVCLSEDNDHWNYQVAGSVYVLGQSPSSWRKIRAVPPARLCAKNACCAHGDMHWFSGEDFGPSGIISFDFNKEEFSWTPHPTLDINLAAPVRQNCHLLNYKGSLAIVDTSISSPARFVKIWVMKNYSTKEWSLDYSIDFHRLETNTLGNFNTQMVRRMSCTKWGMLDIREIDISMEKYSCGEWKNGIFFVEPEGGGFRSRPSVCYFLDLRCNSMRRVETAWSKFGQKRIFSYTQSLISLKDFF